jgi:hypothetical protein
MGSWLGLMPRRVEVWRHRFTARPLLAVRPGGKPWFPLIRDGRIYCFGLSTNEAVPAQAPLSLVGGTKTHECGIVAVVREEAKLKPEWRLCPVDWIGNRELAWELTCEGGLKVIAIDPSAEVVLAGARRRSLTGPLWIPYSRVARSTEQLPNHFNVVESRERSGTIPYEPEEIASKVRPLAGPS